jgi:predicted transcriptional regulator
MAITFRTNDEIIRQLNDLEAKLNVNTRQKVIEIAIVKLYDLYKDMK